jgi:hypothetical protein
MDPRLPRKSKRPAKSPRKRQIFDDLASRVTRLEAIVRENRKQLRMQFQRIAQLQADVDRMRAATPPE